MDNLSSQDLRFLDSPVNSPMLNGYKAEQLYGLSSIPPPAPEAIIEPPVREGFIQSSSTELSHAYLPVSSIYMTDTGLNTPKNDLKCNSCDRVFTRKFDLKRHTDSVHENKKFQCDVCDKYFARKDVLFRHKNIHKKVSEKRGLDAKEAPPSKKVKINEALHSRNNNPRLHFSKTEEAFNGIMRKFRLENTEGFRDIMLFLSYLKPRVFEEINQIIMKHEIKLNFRLFCLYEKGIDGQFIQDVKCFFNQE